MENNKVYGAESAAILIMSIGENSSSEIMKYLSPNEIFNISIAMSRLNNVTKDKAILVLNNFCEQVSDHTGVAVGVESSLREILSNSIGRQKADIIIDRIFKPGVGEGIEILQWMEPKVIYEIILQEHPQIIAIILSFLEPQQSAEVLSELPEQSRVDVLMRIASLTNIQPSAMEDLNQMIEEQISTQNKTNLKTVKINGIKNAANILVYINESNDSSILNAIANNDPAMAEKLQDAMFLFEELANFNDKDIQTILREISSESLVVALKGTDERLTKKIFSNLSKRAASMLQEDLDNRGQVRQNEIDTAKKEILDVVRKLIIAGDISNGGADIGN